MFLDILCLSLITAVPCAVVLPSFPLVLIFHFLLAVLKLESVFQRHVLVVILLLLLRRVVFLRPRTPSLLLVVVALLSPLRPPWLRRVLWVHVLVLIKPIVCLPVLRSLLKPVA